MGMNREFQAIRAAAIDAVAPDEDDPAEPDPPEETLREAEKRSWRERTPEFKRLQCRQAIVLGLFSAFLACTIWVLGLPVVAVVLALCAVILFIGGIHALVT